MLPSVIGGPGGGFNLKGLNLNFNHRQPIGYRPQDRYFQLVHIREMAPLINQVCQVIPLVVFKERDLKHASSPARSLVSRSKVASIANIIDSLKTDQVSQRPASPFYHPRRRWRVGVLDLPVRNPNHCGQ